MKKLKDIRLMEDSLLDSYLYMHETFKTMAERDTYHPLAEFLHTYNKTPVQQNLPIIPSFHLFISLPL